MSDHELQLRVNHRFIAEQEHELYPDKPVQWFGHRDCGVCGPGPLKRWQVPSAFTHIFYALTTEWRSDGGYGGFEEDVRVRCSPEEAMVVSSEIDGEPGMHTILLDIDHPMRDVESSTPGHHHLYIDLKLPWWRYRRLLKALAKAEVIEWDYYLISKKRRATHLRPPWVRKDNS